MNDTRRTKKYTPDDIWAMFAKTEANMDRMSKEAAERAKEFDERMKKAAQEAAERAKEADKRSKALDEKLDKLSEQIGGVGNNAGFHAEQFFQDILLKTLTFGGEKYDSMHPNLPYARGKEQGEFDIVLINGKSVAIIEVKHRIHPNFVKTMADERINTFRRFFKGYSNHKIYLGIAGFSFSEKVVEEAKKRGIGIIRQVGESVEVDAEHLKAY